MTESADTTTSPPLSQQFLTAIEAFDQEHPDLAEALRVLGISNAQYERAISALQYIPVRTSNSTSAD